MSVRFASRYIRNSVVNVITAFLTDYEWTGGAPPFGTTAVAIRSGGPDPADLAAIDGNTVFVSFGNEADMSTVQLGGGVLRQEYIVFVDVVGVDETIADLIATDIRDRLVGLFGGTRYLRPVDPNTGAEMPGYLGEFTEVVKYRADTESRCWVTISANLVMDFPGEDT